MKLFNREKTSKKKSVTFNLIEVIVVIVITSIVVATATSIVVYKNYNELRQVKSDTPSNFSELESAYNNILKSYVEKVDESKLVDAAIQGMYNYLSDPYTTYLDSETTTTLMERLNGEYYGLGIEFTKNENGLQVMTVFKDSPAETGGLYAGDIITSIDGVDVTEYTAQGVADLIKGTDKKKITITVQRGTISITREIDLSNVVIPAITSHNYDGVGYIKIDTFSNTAYKQFKIALEELESEGITSLVIDVRSNGGGYLSSAVDIAELFISKGKKIYGLEYTNDTQYYYDNTKESRNYKIAVLTNGGSASASEILAAALKESAGAIQVGTKTYGKGTVQETNSLSSGGMVKYTTAYWLTPNGNNINGKGLNPDVEIDGEYASSMTLEEDVQLQKAIDAVKQ